jgi:hypothetical protein
MLEVENYINMIDKREGRNHTGVVGIVGWEAD